MGYNKLASETSDGPFQANTVQKLLRNEELFMLRHKRKTSAFGTNVGLLYPVSFPVKKFQSMPDSSHFISISPVLFQFLQTFTIFTVLTGVDINR